VNHVFYSMVEKGLPVSQIVEEMNWAVKLQSPADRFVSAFVACIDPYNRIIETWNGGIPSAMLVDDAGEIIHSFVPNNLPLGILDRTFVARTDILQWDRPSQLVIYSDGLVEAEDEKGVAWGADNIRRTLAEMPPAGRFDALMDSVHRHLGERRGFDDMTLLMVDCAA
jgi:serine phosphatase RsbU (regulator of sigma subunit)